VDLKAAEQRKVILMLGYHENQADYKFDPPGSQTIDKRTVWPIIQHYNSKDEVQAAFERLRHYWNGLLDTLQVSTPDIHTDRMVNTWNVCQLMATFNFSRSASYFESGIGRGMGFRDSNQDLLGFMHLTPTRGDSVSWTGSCNFLGSAYHQYQPLTERATMVGSGFNDIFIAGAILCSYQGNRDWPILPRSLTITFRQ
jgi:cellobiose phosphorylase